MLGGPQQSVGVVIVVLSVGSALLFYGLWTIFRKKQRGEKVATGEVIMIVIMLVGIIALAVTNVLKHGR